MYFFKIKSFAIFLLVRICVLSNTARKAVIHKKYSMNDFDRFHNMYFFALYGELAHLLQGRKNYDLSGRAKANEFE